MSICAMSVCAIMAAASGYAPAHAQEEAQPTLAPYQMVRSLQLVQDRIAGGDHAALPMQRKLLELVDARLRASTPQEFEDPRNMRSLLVYAMSGGNPDTVDETLETLELDETIEIAGAGIVHYLRGEILDARRAFARIEPATYPTELAAFLHLVKGSVMGTESAPQAMAMLDHARLLAPGTLVEEAALRRTMILAREAEDVERFTAASSLYVRRFLRSPYAAQFAQAFVSGIIQFAATIDTARIDQIVSGMSQDQAMTIYLRLARASAIDGNTALLAFASAKVRGDDEEIKDPRGALYTSISQMNSSNAVEVLPRLDALDTRGLTERDRALLSAARAVANEVVAPARTSAIVPGAQREPEAETDAGAEAAPASETAAEQDALVSSARSKLEAIDALIGSAR